MIPKHHEIWAPALQVLVDGRPRRAQDLEAPLATHFELNEEQLGQMYDSGNGPVFFDRISWALSYLNIAGLVQRPKRGTYQISDKGRELLQTPNQIEDHVLEARRERDRQKKARIEAQTIGQAEDVTAEEEADSELTPQERLYESFDKIRASIFDELLDTIFSKSPREFEHLVVKLLQRMGYGGQVEDSGTVSQYTNDGGIDGVIREDVLGLGRIHIQAKRYARSNTVGREEIQRFVGALAVAQSNKGVFITTSSYSAGAREYARSLHGTTTLVLIDGEELARFLYDYGVGMQVEQTIEIKKLDSDFWDGMQDA